jgi:hypothetical protein
LQKWSIDTGREVARALFEGIVLNRGALREMAAHFRDAFALAHQLNFGQSKLLALGQIHARFVGQIGLPKRSINSCVDHACFPQRARGHFLSGTVSRFLATRNRSSHLR